jgi:hypothetical protein
LGGDNRAHRRVGGGAGPGAEVLPQPGARIVHVAPALRGLDPMAFPADAVGLRVVLQQHDDVAGQPLRQQEQRAVLVPGDAHVDAGHNRDSPAPQHLQRAVGGAVIGDDQIDRVVPRHPPDFLDGLRK